MEAPINDFNGPGLYLFQVQHSKKYLDLDESKKANHTKVQQWYGNLWCPGRISTDMVNLVTGRHESTMRTRTGSLLPQGMTNTSSWRTRQGHVWLLLVLSLFIYIMSKKWNFLLVNMSLSFSQRKTENQLLYVDSVVLKILERRYHHTSERYTDKDNFVAFIVWLILIRFLTSKVLATKMVLLC